jgi:beta-hydroxylase
MVRNWLIEQGLSMDLRSVKRKVGYGIFHLVESVMKSRSIFGYRNYFENRDFPWVEQVEKAYPAILDELEAVLVDRKSIPPLQAISPYQDKLSNDSKWKVFYLKAWGDDVQENCKRCPMTVEALKAIPGMTTAFFSIMEPNKEIPMHRGPYNGVLRYHLGVIVPERFDQCGIEVDGEVYHWREGESRIFDDTFQHRAWNRTDQTRVVLFVDFLRPLPFFSDLLNRGVIKLVRNSPIYKQARKNFQSWKVHVESADACK